MAAVPPNPHPPSGAVLEAVERAVREDVLGLGDLTASLIPQGTTASLAVVAREPGVLAGERCARAVFAQLAPETQLDWRIPEGSRLSPGDEIVAIDGALAPILTAERTALNFLCHLSGVATLTRRFVDAVSAVDAEVRIVDTRKTTPGLRALEKAAVRAGGGHNHRGSLSDAVLIKDNHLGGLSITRAIEGARRAWPGRTVEIECDREEQVSEACRAGADIVMLDNFDPERAARCVAVVREASPTGRVLFEASGGVNLDSAPRFAAAGVDIISVGALTHSAPILDLALDLRSGG
jgi:nicotinate-nucleotide pyrophosphorylase (carboxylating)